MINKTKIKYFNSEAGISTLPAVITVAVILGILQVPLLYKVNSSTQFSGTQKVDMSAKSMAESGVEQVIADIGLKKLRIKPTTDTLAYHNMTLGKGKYSAQVTTYSTSPERVLVKSEGQFRGTSQGVTAKLELIRTISEIPYSTAKQTLWGIDNSTRTLIHYSLAERDSGFAWVHPEGLVDVGTVSSFNVDDFTVAINGNMYFINNVDSSVLYKIRPMDLDDNGATKVPAHSIGATGLAAGTDNQIRGLIFVNGVLYAATWRSKIIYELSLATGAATPVCTLKVAGNFEIDAMTVGDDGTVYITRTNGGSELWQFDDWAGNISMVTPISAGINKVRAISGHPNGYIYANDGAAWYRIDPVAKSSTLLFAYVADLRGMGFEYEREHYLFDGTPLSKKTRICHIPAGNPANEHTIVVGGGAVAAHVGKHGGCYVGYCGLALADSTAWVRDTVVQVRIISWEEEKGI